MVNLHLKNIQDRLVHLPSHSPPRSLLSKDADAAVNAVGSSLPLPAWASPFQTVRRFEICPSRRPGSTLLMGGEGTLASTLSPLIPTHPAPRGGSPARCRHVAAGGRCRPLRRQADNSGHAMDGVTEWDK